MKRRMLGWLSGFAMALVLSACGGGGETVTLPTALELCGSVGLQPKVFNGSNCADPQKSPAVLLLTVQDGNTYSCSGVMVTPTQVLSAGHCFPSNTSRVAAVLWDANGNSSAVYARRWVVHPAYSESSSGFINDAAVVTLSKSMPNPTMPLLLSQKTTVGNKIFFAGWGLPSSELAVGYGKVTSVNDSRIGIKFDGTLSDTCQGDSGGPAYRDVGGTMGVVGLTSTGTTTNCGASGQSQFTNTQSDSVLGFIRSQAPGAAEI